MHCGSSIDSIDGRTCNTSLKAAAAARDEAFLPPRLLLKELAKGMTWIRTVLRPMHKTQVQGKVNIRIQDMTKLEMRKAQLEGKLHPDLLLKQAGMV